MQITPSREMLRRQLLQLRNEAVWARRGLETNHQPPHGFGDNVASSFEVIAALGLTEGETCQRYAADIRRRVDEPWELGDVDRIIDRIDTAVKELAGSVADGAPGSGESSQQTSRRSPV